MPQKAGHIRVHKMVLADQPDMGIAIERFRISASEEALLNASDEAKKSRREDRHSFFILEKEPSPLKSIFKNSRSSPRRPISQ